MLNRYLSVLRYLDTIVIVSRSSKKDEKNSKSFMYLQGIRQGPLKLMNF